MSPRESSLEDRQREEPSTGASALPSELQLYVLLHRFFLSVLFFLRQFATFLFTLLSLSIGRRIRTVLTTWFGTAAPWPSLLLSYSATNRRYCKLIYCHYFWMDFRHTCACRCMTHYNWTNESELKRDSFPEHSAVFVFQVFPNIFLSSSATEGILLLQSIRSVAISFWSANFPPGVLGEYFSGNALSKRCVTAVAKAQILLDWNASRFFFSMFTFSISRVNSFSSRFLFLYFFKMLTMFLFLSTHKVLSTTRCVTLIILFVTITSVTRNVTVSTNWIVTSNTRRLHNLQFKLSKMGFNS